MPWAHIGRLGEFLWFQEGGAGTYGGIPPMREGQNDLDSFQ
jgi:hypothetical protein